MPHPSRAGPLVGCFHLEGVPWHHLSPPPPTAPSNVSSSQTPP